MRLACNLDIRDNFILVLIQTSEHLRLSTVVDKVPLTDLLKSSKVTNKLIKSSKLYCVEDKCWQLCVVLKFLQSLFVLPDPHCQQTGPAPSSHPPSPWSPASPAPPGSLWWIFFLKLVPLWINVPTATAPHCTILVEVESVKDRIESLLSRSLVQSFPHRHHLRHPASSFFSL